MCPGGEERPLGLSSPWPLWAQRVCKESAAAVLELGVNRKGIPGGYAALWGFG